MTARAELAALEATIATAPSAIVAFSGGVDSSLVAAATARVLGERALAVTAVSPALATGELDGARTVAATVGIAHRTITTDELAREGYRRNGEDRCYHCKSELYDRLAALGATEGYAVVFSGANMDDLGDWRPGLRAAAEHDVRHPLVESGFGKTDVRHWASTLSIPSADKPAMPCLASRLPYGTHVDPAILAQVDRAELAVRALGYRDLRVRHLGRTARVELADVELALVGSPEERDAIVSAVVGAGYDDAVIDERPLRSGSFTGRLLPLAISS
jgi:uncharacterized protein